MYLHARVYRVLDFIQVDLRTEPTPGESRQGVVPSARTFSGGIPAALEGMPELVVFLEALRAAARNSLLDLEGSADYSGPVTLD